MLLSKLLLFLNWQIHGAVPDGINKYIIVAGTHTSNWDFVLTMTAAKRLGLRPKVLIKQEVFYPVIGGLLKAMGGIPIDRDQADSVVDETAELLKRSSNTVLIIAPEGTRKGERRLKTGFIRIAQQAELPVVPVTIHANEKLLRIHPIIDIDHRQTAIDTLTELFEASYGLRAR